MTTFAPGDIVITPLGQRARLVHKRRIPDDGYWDAVYIDAEGNELDKHQAQVALQPKTMRHE